MIVVTGGAGFIDSNIVKELNNQGRMDILIVDDLEDEQYYKNLRGLQFIDYQHKADFLQMIGGADFDGTDIDVVFHEGACSDTMEYGVNYMMKVNYEYSKTLRHFCMVHHIPFLCTSLVSTYASGANAFIEGDDCEDALKYFNVYSPQEHHKGEKTSIVYQLYNQLKANGYVKLLMAGYDQGFHTIKAGNAIYCKVLEQGGYFTYGK